MKTFKKHLKEDEGYYIGANGDVVLSKVIGEKLPNTKRMSKNVFEGFDLSGFKQAAKPSKKSVPHESHEARHDLHDSKKRTNINDAQMNKNIYGETGHELMTHVRGSDIEEVGSLSGKLEQKMTPAQHKAFHHFTTGKSDTIGDGHKWASTHIARHFITAHNHANADKGWKHKRDSHIQQLTGQDHDTAEHLKTAAKPLGHEVHLYSGVHPSFVQAIKHAHKHKDGVVNSVAPISTTHDIETAGGFAIGDRHDSDKSRPINKNNNYVDKTTKDHVAKTTKHIIHVHAKATDKGIHMSGVEGNKYAAEAETVLPPATHLKYSHTTHHHTSESRQSPHQAGKIYHRIDVHHFTVHKQD